jgi:type I restriction enzyme S subunit
MQVEKLEDICEIASGGTPKRSEDSYWKNGKIPWLKISDIKSKYVDKSEEHITQKGLDNSSAKLFKKGTIIYTIFATVGEVAILNIDATTNQAIAGLTVKDSAQINPSYLFYFLKSIKKQMHLLSRGVAQNNINLSVLRQIKVPIPDLNVQERIVNALDQMQNNIKLRQMELSKLDILIKARFVEMFGDPMIKKDDRNLRKLKEICIINPKKNLASKFSNDIEVSFVPMSSVSEQGDIDVSQRKNYSEVRKGFTYFAENDVLFAKITPCMENGKGAIATGLINGIGFGSTEFHILRPIKNITNPYWIYVLTSFKSFRKLAEVNMTGSAGQRRVPATFLKDYEVRLPPIELQNEFASFAQQVDKSKVAIQKSLDETQTLFDSLMQKYFS